MRLTTTAATLLMLLAVQCPIRAQMHCYPVGGGDLMQSPVVFSGGFDVGGDIDQGQWSIRIPDEDWPSDPEERLDYIVATFFVPNYFGLSSIGPSYWLGYFDVAHGLAEPITWFIQDDTNGGTIGGTSDWAFIRALDLNGSGELEREELCKSSYLEDDPLTPMLLCLDVDASQSSGFYANQGGSGSTWGSRVQDCPGWQETWALYLLLWLDDSPNRPLAEEVSWTRVKALYR